MAMVNSKLLVYQRVCVCIYINPINLGNPQTRWRFLGKRSDYVMRRQLGAPTLPI